MPNYMRRIFWFVNKFFMVPIFRLGLGPLFVNPFTGYIMVLKLVGRKSGKTRFAPVNYAIHKGDIYCVSGGRKTSDWFKNLLAAPDIEIILPSGPVYAHAEEIHDLEARRVIIRQILVNAGFAGYFEGYNPATISDDEMLSKSGDMPLLRLHPLGVGSGASDQGGWAWVWVWLATTLLVILLLK